MLFTFNNVVLGFQEFVYLLLFQHQFDQVVSANVKHTGFSILNMILFFSFFPTHFMIRSQGGVEWICTKGKKRKKAIKALMHLFIGRFMAWPRQLKRCRIGLEI